jgi:hypothetical protein
LTALDEVKLDAINVQVFALETQAQISVISDSPQLIGASLERCCAEKQQGCRY